MANPVLKIYSAVDRALKLNLQGISNDESFMQVGTTNCINWLAGHIVYSRNSALALLGLHPVAGEKLKPVYERGSKRMTNSQGAESLESLMKLFDESQQKIMEGLAKVTDEQLLEKLAFSGFHEAYHVGQVATARKLIGKEGMIK